MRRPPLASEPHDRVQHVRMVSDRLHTTAWAADFGKVVTQPYALRVVPLPTGTRWGSKQSP
jgi:hypothetical protein